MYMGELITKRGIGNGISLLIFASILVSAPAGVTAWYNGGPMEKLFFPLIALGDHRRGRLHAGGAAPDPDPVRQAHDRTQDDVGRIDLSAPAREHGGRDPDHLRRRAARLPQTLGSFPPNTQSFINQHFAPTTWAYIIVEATLIMLFTFFYTAVQFNPVDQADNLRKHGGYIPGIRPGPADGAVPRPRADPADAARLDLPRGRRRPAEHLHQYGGFSQATSRALGGTSVLIVVGVALDTMRQMESQMMMRSYEGFLK